MHQSITTILSRTACLAGLFAGLSANAALAQPKSEIIGDKGQFVALNDNSKGMMIYDDYPKPGPNGQVMVDTWLILAGPTTRNGDTFDAIYASQMIDCRAGTFRDVSVGLQNGATRFDESWATKKEMVKPPANSPAVAIIKEVCDPAPSTRAARFTSYREAASFARLQIKSRNEVWNSGRPAAATGRFELLNASQPTTVLEGQPEQVGEARYGRIWLMYAAPQATKTWKFDNLGVMYAVRCDRRDFRMVATVAFLGESQVAVESVVAPYQASKKGTIADVVVTRLCGAASPTAQVTSSRAAARAWAK